MKKNYSKPFFFAEAYRFSSSIAKCDIDIDTTEPLTFIKTETNACSGGDGHVYGGNNGSKGTIVTKCNGGNQITLFNDGIEKTACEFDWDGRKNIVAQTGDNFAVSMYGNDADVKKHAPSYGAQVFLS